jgi:hypothetical protein
VFGDDSVIKGRLEGSLYRLGDSKRVAGWLGVLSARPAVGESNREERRGRRVVSPARTGRGLFGSRG